MRKEIDIKNRIVNVYDADTGEDQDEIIGYLDKQMKIRFHSVYFSPKCKYQFTGSPDQQSVNSITVNGYTEKNGGSAVIIK